MRHAFFFPAALAVAALLPATPTSAAELIGTFADWSAFKGQENGNLVCYAGSEPTSSHGAYTKRDPAYLLVTHRPAAGESGIVNVVAGYIYMQDSEADAVIGGESFRLFTSGGDAWAYRGYDAKIVQAMKRGTRMVVTGTSSRGTETTDTYSLAGFTAAYGAAAAACGAE